MNKKKEGIEMVKDNGNETTMTKKKEGTTKGNVKDEGIEVVNVDEDNAKIKTTMLEKSKKDNKLTVLMDSNRRFIEFKKLFKGKEIEVIPCGSIEAANNILNNEV